MICRSKRQGSLCRKASSCVMTLHRQAGAGRAGRQALGGQVEARRGAGHGAQGRAAWTVQRTRARAVRPAHDTAMFAWECLCAPGCAAGPVGCALGALSLF